MIHYSNRSNTSCVYDAFEQAGLPVSDDMQNGVTARRMFQLLEKYGYKIYKKGTNVNLPIDKGFFVIRTPINESAHAEYHIGFEDVINYPPETICAIAIK